METSQPKKAPYKRTMTDKRRDQNRAAQRKYRAKRKEQLARLEDTVVALTTTNTTTTTTGEGNQVVSERRRRRRIEEDDLSSETNDEKRDGRSISHPDSITSTSTTSQTTNTNPSPSAPTKPSSPQDNPNLTTLLRLLSSPSSSPQTSPSPPDPDTEPLLLFALREQFPISKVLLAGLRALKAETEKSSIAPLTRSNGVDWRPELWPSTSTSGGPLTSQILPDPLMNGILLRRQAPLEVFYYNCRQIGLAFEEMALPTCRSPWYSPPSPSSVDGGGSEIRLHLDSVPPDLKPTPAQLTIAHHPFWDTIPFPWIRERIITLSALENPPFRWHDLKADILQGGMVCWRSRAREEGLPWDRRSWEVKPWFRQKWGWLIEEQGKVEQQSRWWRAMQGHEV